MIEENIRRYIADNILFSGNGYPYSDDTSFLENGVVDSMNVMELVAYVEDHFKITVEDSEIIPANFDSVTNLARYLRSKGI